MRRVQQQCLFFLVFFLISACGSLEHTASPPSTPPSAPPLSKSQPKDNPIRIARSMIGKPYRFGGSHPRTGFDCSGLLYYSFQQRIPRSSRQQFAATKAVKRNNLQPGDLVFFNIAFTKIGTSKRAKVSHVGLYVGNGKFIHAPSSGKAVMQSSLTQDYWRKRFIRGGRF